MNPSDAATIGANTTVVGALRGDVPLTVHGRIEGSVQLQALLTIEAGATVEADVEVASLTVHGTLTGNVVAADRVTLSRSARVTGSLRAKRLQIEDGARFQGKIDMDEA